MTIRLSLTKTISRCRESWTRRRRMRTVLRWSKSASKALGEGRVASALQAYETALTVMPDDTAALHYNLGCIFDRSVGDGLAARKHYAAALAAPGISGREAISACCYENMMLLSLCYDEYEQWARQLQRIRPDEPILSGQWPSVRRSAEEGHPWWEVMDGFTSAYYNFHDPSRDQGLYGKAASVHSLIIDHRDEMQLDLNNYWSVGGQYGAEVLKLSAMHGLATENLQMVVDPRELRPVLQGAVNRLKVYMSVFPDEKRVATCLNCLQAHLCE